MLTDVDGIFDKNYDDNNNWGYASGFLSIIIKCNCHQKIFILSYHQTYRNYVSAYGLDQK